MLKKGITAVLLCLLLAGGLNAQKRSGAAYSNAFGLHIEFGTGSTLIGPTFKHFFSRHDAGQVNLLFANHYTQLDLEYQYHGSIQSASA
jgi:hypothetical protein